MYSRSFYPESGESSIPENYVGTAFSEVASTESHEESAPKEESSTPTAALAKSEGILSSFANIPFLSSLFKGDGGLFKMPKIGSEEILIIAIAALLFFSKDGDKECALILLFLLFVS